MRQQYICKKLDCIEEMMKDAETGCPYKGAKEHYILDIDNSEFCKSNSNRSRKGNTITKTKKKK